MTVRVRPKQPNRGARGTSANRGTWATRAAWAIAALVALVLPPVVVPAIGAATRSKQPARADADMLSDRACIECHPDEAAQWRGSPHQTSFVEWTFQAAIAREPRAYCRACHAPLSNGGGKVSDAAAEIGVGCTSCHVREGNILASPGTDGPEVAPHPVTRTAALSEVDACAGCHEFDFPDTLLRDRPLTMQRTIIEHAGSRFADVTCVGCHMPREEDGQRSHAFFASRDPDLVRAAVEVDAVRISPTVVQITLRAAQVGHAFPTGDLLRRVEVGAVAVLAEGEGPTARRFLARHFADRVQSSGARVRVETSDDRVPADGERVVELKVPEAAGQPVRWWVDYQRVAHQRTPNEADAIVDGGIAVARGLLPARPIEGTP